MTVKINGLPAGLKADPVTVAGKDSSFVVKVVADAKAHRGHRRHADRPGVSGREEGLFGSADSAGGEGCSLRSRSCSCQ